MDCNICFVSMYARVEFFCVVLRTVVFSVEKIPRKILLWVVFSKSGVLNFPVRIVCEMMINTFWGVTIPSVGLVVFLHDNTTLVEFSS